VRSSTFTHDFLLLFAGPLVWAVHFLAIYGFTGVLCARPGMGGAWLGIAVASWVLVGAGVVAIVAVVLCFAVKPRDATPDNRRFVRTVSMGLGLLAIVAIAWETLTVFLVPACA
jgi:hypothetical protein